MVIFNSYVKLPEDNFGMVHAVPQIFRRKIGEATAFQVKMILRFSSGDTKQKCAKNVICEMCVCLRTDFQSWQDIFACIFFCCIC